MLLFLVVDLSRAVRETCYFKGFFDVGSVSRALQAIAVHCNWCLGFDLTLSHFFVQTVECSLLPINVVLCVQVDINVLCY